MGIFENPVDFLWRIPALLIAITFHEYAHARMAYVWGDPTAKLQGRLTLNPIAHLDPLGTIMFLFAQFGWARPVPINPMRFRNQRRGLFWVSLAGPAMNLLIGFAAVYILLSMQGIGHVFQTLLYNIIIFNVFLAVFNIVPLPPLDGSKILASLLPQRYLKYFDLIEPYGPFILIILLVFGVFSLFLVPISFFIINGFSFLLSFLII